MNRPSNFVALDSVPSFPDTCGSIKEVYTSKNMSLALAELHGKATKHKHKVMEEVYFIVEGTGFLTIGEKCHPIAPGDTISIPKDAWHFLETKEILKVLVATYPKFMKEDVIIE